MISGIYAIKNTVNQKVYVGSSRNVASRWRAHRLQLRNGTHTNQWLQHAWSKYGERAFEFILIQERAESVLLDAERYWTSCLQALEPAKGYNIAEDPLAPMTGRKHTKEAREKMSKAHKGHSRNKGRKFTPEQIEACRLRTLGRKHSAETKAKMSLASKGHHRNKGRKCSPETIAKLRAKVVSAETRAKMSAALMGNTRGAGRKGLKHSAETKLKIRLAHKNNHKKENEE